MKILCPTDLSKHSKTAIEYAIQQANLLDAELHILNAFSVRKTASSLVRLDDIIEKNSQEDLDYFINSLKNKDLLSRPLVSKVMQGEAVDSINLYAKMHQIDLIILGTQGQNSMKNVLFGSTALRVLEKTVIPILAIPLYTEENEVNNKCLLAIDDKEVTGNDNMTILYEICRKSGLIIDLIHAYEGKELVPFDSSIISELDDLYGEAHVIESHHPVVTIHQFANEHNYSMICMIKRPKSLLEKLFVVPHTSAEILSTDVPLLIIPQ